MAGDLVRLLDHLGIPTAHFIGHTESAGVLLALLIDYPKRVDRAVLTGAVARMSDTGAFERASLHAEVAALLKGSTPAAAGLKATHMAMSPESERWPDVVERLSAWLTHRSFTPEVLATIKRPVLVDGTSRDQYTSSAEFRSFAASIPGSTLYDAGSATHAVWRKRSEQLLVVVSDFLRTR